jgi:hypothetical protein
MGAITAAYEMQVTRLVDEMNTRVKSGGISKHMLASLNKLHSEFGPPPAVAAMLAKC